MPFVDWWEEVFFLLFKMESDGLILQQQMGQTQEDCRWSKGLVWLMDSRACICNNCFTTFTKHSKHFYSTRFTHIHIVLYSINFIYQAHTQ